MQPHRAEMDVVDPTDLSQPLESEGAILNPLKLLYLKLATPYPTPAYFWPCLTRPLHLPGALLFARPKGALRLSARLIGGGC